MKLAKGFRGMRRTYFRKANEAVMKAGEHAYIDRKKKKRVFRGLWIQRLNAAVRAHGIRYSQFMKNMNDKKIGLNRKALSELAIHEPKVFEEIVKSVS